MFEEATGATKADDSVSADVKSEELVDVCPNCGALFSQPEGRGHPKKFCSEKCRTAWHPIQWMGDTAYVEDIYPRFIMAEDGARYHINGRDFLVIGGAYSVDKPYRLRMGYRWFSDEQLTAAEMDVIRQKVHDHGNREDVGDPKYIPMIKARKKILILGNHDARGTYKDLFREVYAGPLFISDKILLSHEPVYGLPWCLNLHGHDHNGMEAYADGCKHMNLAANVCGYTPINLAKLIKSGILADIDSIHRQTIDRAVEKKQKELEILEEQKSEKDHTERGSL